MQIRISRRHAWLSGALPFVVLMACNDEGYWLGPPASQPTQARITLDAVPELQGRVFSFRSTGTIAGETRTSELPPPPHDEPIKFPGTYAIETEPNAGALHVDVEVLDEDAHVIGRGSGGAELPRGQTTDMLIFVRRSCVGPIDCQNGDFCDGEEQCVDGLCFPPPQVACPQPAAACASNACDADAGRCVPAVHHDRCTPLETDGGMEARFCDPQIGCTLGVPCYVDDDCQDGRLCNGREICSSRHCIPGPEPAVDDGNPCTFDACLEDAGPSHRPELDGDFCPLGADTQGICLQGRCGASRCNDGYLDARNDEECDVGRNNDDTMPNACRTNCRLPSCGDGVTDTGEDCDTGDPDDPACPQCLRNECGDGLPNPGIEQCDDGNLSFNDTCLPNCVRNACGDGHVNIGIEACDDGNRSNLDGCLATCVVNTCGDMFVDDAREKCDDGNQVSGDGCRADCGKIELCGDRIVDTGEGCDDGNDDPNDGCDACRRTIWNPTVEVGLLQTTVPPDQFTMSYPRGVVVERGGAVLVSDSASRRVWRRNPVTGVVTPAMGRAAFGTLAYIGGQALTVNLDAPRGMAIDPAGTLYVADSSSCLVWKRAADGLVSIFAGQYFVCDHAGENQPPTFATMKRPTAVAVFGARVFIADEGSHRVRLVDSNGLMTTFVGNGTAGSSPEGTLRGNAQVNAPSALAVDALGNLLIAEQDGNRVIRIATTSGFLSVVAGTGAASSTGDNGPAALATVDSPAGLAFDGQGNLWISESGGHRVRRVDTAGFITTVAGTGTAGFSGDNGPATDAMLNGPGALAWDGTRMLVVDTGNSRVRAIAADGTITTHVGNTPRLSDPTIGRTDYPASAVEPGLVIDVASARDGSMYVMGGGPYGAVWKVSPQGTAVRIAGSLDAVPDGGDGLPALEAQLNNPQHLTEAPNGDLYISQFTPFRVRRVRASTGLVDSVIGGGPPEPLADGMLASAVDAYVPGMAFSSDGTLYFAMENALWRLNGDGTVTRVVGSTAGFADGPVATALFTSPQKVAAAPNGDFVIAEISTRRIRRYRIATQDVVTIAGNGTAGDTVDGTLATNAMLRVPTGLMVDAQDNVWIGDGEQALLLRRDAMTGVLNIAAGKPGMGPIREGGAPRETYFSSLFSVGLLGVAMDARGEVWVADSWYGRARRVDPMGIVRIGLGNVDLGDGSFAYAQVHTPSSLVRLGNAWLVAGELDGKVRRIDRAAQQVRTVIGYPFGFESGEDPAGRSRYHRQLVGIGDMTADAASNRVFISETFRHIVHEVTLVDPANPETWTIRVVAGSNNTPGYRDGPAATSLLDRPYGLAFDGARNRLLIAEDRNSTIRELDLSTSTLRTIAGTQGVRGFYGEGTPATDALFSAVEGLKLAPDGSLYVADTYNNRIRRIDPDGIIRTVVGDGTFSSRGDGAPARLQLAAYPRAMVLDAWGNLFFTSENAVRMVRAGDDGIATGDDEAATIFGAVVDTGSVLPTLTQCLHGLALEDPATASRLVVTDSCVGMVFRLDRAQLPP